MENQEKQYTTAALKRTKEIKLRLTEAEHYIITGKAYKAGKQIAVYVREAGLNKEIKTAVTPEQLKIRQNSYKQTVEIVNELNEVVKLAKQEKLSRYATTVESLIARINEQLSKYE